MIGAHNDECEYGLGGVTWLLKNKGCSIKYINTSGLWHKKGYTPEERDEWIRQEQEAAHILGAEKIVMGDRDLNLCEDGNEVVLEIERMLIEEMPDIVFIHYPKDNHLEHRMAAKNAYAAVCLSAVHGTRINEIYAFEAGPNQTSDYFRPDFYINVADSMDKVKESLMQFDQPTAKGPGLWLEKEKQAAYRGYMAHVPYAECFKVVKYPTGSNDFLLRTLLTDKFRWAGNYMYPANGEIYF